MGCAHDKSTLYKSLSIFAKSFSKWAKKYIESGEKESTKHLNTYQEV